MKKTSVNASLFKSEQEYVCWIDIMGTKNSMSESLQKATNFILKFHSCVTATLEKIRDTTPDHKISVYPLMDGVFITSPTNTIIRKVIDSIFSSVANLFMTEDRHGHRFIIKGSLSYGYIAHGRAIDKKICQQLADEDNYKNSIMCGLPMIQAFNAEHTAPPFGIYIHESARRPQELQGKYYIWKPTKDFDKEKLMKKIISYFDWCTEYINYMEINASKLDLYKQLTQEYFTDRMRSDIDNADSDMQ